MLATYYNNATEAFESLFECIMNDGYDTKINTKRITNVMITMLNPTDRQITTPWRKWSNRYAEREWEWYLSGNRSVEQLKRYAPTWDKMHGGDNIVNSNYGWQWNRNNQLQKCIDQLKIDPYTRQSWISIFDGKEKDDYKYDTPCTLSVGFEINPANSDLDMIVMMRSNDLVYGFCNDQYCFSKLQEKVAKELKRPVGTYTHIVHDMHIYKKHFNLKSK